MENNVYIPLPEKFADRVAVNVMTLTVYADTRIHGDPLLLSWRDRNKASGFEFTIEKADMGEIARMRENGQREVEQIDQDMLVRTHAMDIIGKAAAYRASDIHLMMRGEHAEIQFVIKGGLRSYMSLTHEEGEALTRAIYQGIAKTRDSSYNIMEFQNAQVPGSGLPPEANLTSIRIIRGPSYPQSQNGQFMTMRLQYGEAKPQANSSGKKALPALPLPRVPSGAFELGRMGFSPKQIGKIHALMDAPNGIIIMTGPTGSGKTTTLYECLKETARNKPHRRLVTIEDPVEYPMNWATQLYVTDARNEQETGHAFQERLRVALRMAPNNIFIGELRGPEVALAALDASVTGHQVWSTMHVTDPFLFVERLELMDSERLNRRAFCDHKIVRGVIAQRLLPKLCFKCSTPHLESKKPLSSRIVEALKSWGNADHIRLTGPGCETCGGDGTIDRFAVAEIVVMNAAVMSDFLQRGSEIARENYRASADADPSMLETAIGLCLKGLVDPRAIEDYIDLIEPRASRPTTGSSAHPASSNVMAYASRAA